MGTIRSIRLKRISIPDGSAWSSATLGLNYGEPCHIKKSSHDYLAVGDNEGGIMTVSGSRKFRAVPENVSDVFTFYKDGAFASNAVNNIKNLTDEYQNTLYPTSISTAIWCKKESGGSSWSNARNLDNKLKRIDQIIGDLNDAAGTIGAQNGNHETRMDTIETVMGINGHSPGTGVEYVNTTLSSANTKYYLIGVPATGTKLYNARAKDRDYNDAGIYWNGKDGVLFGAAWNNDYAEGRELLKWEEDEIVEPGTCVVETGNGKITPSTEELLPCAYVVSDTYGMVIGPDDQTPIALCGRVLAKVRPDNYELGDCLCSSINGNLRKMTRDEIVEFPDRIVGTVCEIPDYDEWHGRKVNGRIWIKIK